MKAGPRPSGTAGCASAWRRFGLNRSEVKLRLGLSVGVSFPRVPGIEAAGTIDAAPAGSGLAAGQKVVAMMGDRTYDGGYAEYASVPLSQVIPVDTDLPWEVLGALPEMVQTAYGSLTIGLDLKPHQSVLIRGCASSVGLAAAALAAWRGATVLSRTRQPDRLTLLKEHGVDHPLLDTGKIAPAVRELYPDGVDAALDLVGTPTLPDTLRAVRIHGTVCFGGSLSNQWAVRDFPRTNTCRGVCAWRATSATPATCLGRPSRRSSTRSRRAGWPSPGTTSTTAWSSYRRPTTTWNTTARPASSPFVSGTSTPANTGRSSEGARARSPSPEVFGALPPPSRPVPKREAPISDAKGRPHGRSRTTALSSSSTSDPSLASNNCTNACTLAGPAV
jgi:NADPH:quinone reductase-like Zn-dependent oxidoreductase